MTQTINLNNIAADTDTNNQTLYKKLNITSAQKNQIKHCIANDGIICYPTEAVWGLGCHPQSEKAFQKLLDLKQRSTDKGVILVASDYQQLKPYVLLDSFHKSQLSNIWPSFVTCLLPASPNCPDYLRGNHPKIAVRLSANPIINILCQLSQTALVSTSANVSGQAPVSNLEEAKKTFSHGVDIFIDAPLGGEQKPSRIIEFHNHKIIIHRN